MTADFLYPEVRSHGPPPFLEKKYAGVEALFIDSARRRALTDSLDVRQLAGRLPTFSALFSASQPEIVSAIQEALAPSEGVEAARSLALTLRALLIWEDLDAIQNTVKAKCTHVVGGFPRNLSDLEQRGGRDIIDPFMVAIGPKLLGIGLEEFVQNLLAHKCLMKIEDLIGNLHQDVLGKAAGKERIPEPVGIPIPGGRRNNKETWHPELNPFPGADARFAQSEFYQIKNKTGSAKGGDGQRLGRQFDQLRQHYPDCQRFYISVIGKTLAGHRSMGGVLREDDRAEVLVGLPALQQLGGHRDTPAILMDLILEILDEVMESTGYNLAEVAARVVHEWQEKYGAEDSRHALLHGLLRDTVTNKNPRLQQSTTYVEDRKKGRLKS